MKEQKVIPFVDKEPIEVIFTDIIELSINNETAQLKLGIKSPTGENALCTHRVVMTTPHFLRLAGIIKETTDEILKQVKNNSNESINP